LNPVSYELSIVVKVVVLRGGIKRSEYGS